MANSNTVGLSSDWKVPALLVAMGAAWRVLWLILNPDKLKVLGEASNVAISFARSGSFADPYGPGTGPTAHVNPLLPFVNGLVYRLLGVESAPSLWLLSLMAIAITVGTAWIAYLAFCRIGMDRRSAQVAMGLFLLLPLNPSLEAASFRIWEGGLAVLLWAWLLLLILRCEEAKRLGWQEWTSLGLIGALLFFVSPPLGLAGYGGLGILLLRRSPWQRWPRAIAICALTLAVMVVPWGLRNQNALGKFIPLRSNFGLEFALSNNPVTSRNGDTEASFNTSFQALHPINNRTVFAKVKQVGEVAYAQGVGATATKWVRDHPSAFAALSLHHLVHFYLPQSSVGAGAAFKLAITIAISVLGLAGVLAAFVVWRGRWYYPAVAALLPALPYMVIHSNVRYRYLVLVPLLFLATQFCARLLALAGLGATTGGRPVHPK